MENVNKIELLHIDDKVQFYYSTQCIYSISLYTVYTGTFNIVQVRLLTNSVLHCTRSRPLFLLFFARLSADLSNMEITEKN